jgi:hypothetical protein
MIDMQLHAKCSVLHVWFILNPDISNVCTSLQYWSNAVTGGLVTSLGTCLELDPQLAVFGAWSPVGRVTGGTGSTVGLVYFGYLKKESWVLSSDMPPQYWSSWSICTKSSSRDLKFWKSTAMNMVNLKLLCQEKKCHASWNILSTLKLYHHHNKGFPRLYYIIIHNVGPGVPNRMPWYHNPNQTTLQKRHCFTYALLRRCNIRSNRKINRPGVRLSNLKANFSGAYVNLRSPRTLWLLATAYKSPHHTSTHEL